MASSISRWELDEGYALYRNTGAEGAGNNWINIRLIGGGDINRDAIGARVYLSTDDGRTLLQEVKSGSSLGAGNDTALHFGLGEARISEVLIRWPTASKRRWPISPSINFWKWLILDRRNCRHTRDNAAAHANSLAPGRI